MRDATDWLKLDNYQIAKAHVKGRRYVAVVLDLRLPVKEREVYRAGNGGWTRATRDDCRAWIRANRTL